jgi:hypothetical protein
VLLSLLSITVPQTPTPATLQLTLRAAGLIYFFIDLYPLDNVLLMQLTPSY